MTSEVAVLPQPGTILLLLFLLFFFFSSSQQHSTVQYLLQTFMLLEMMVVLTVSNKSIFSYGWNLNLVSNFTQILVLLLVIFSKIGTNFACYFYKRWIIIKKTTCKIHDYIKQDSRGVRISKTYHIFGTIQKIKNTR